MWLLPHLSAVSGAAVRVYYRASRSGERVPANGPLMIVGNHPNSLLDPAFLAWVAERPVRFLAKAPLFSDRLIGWLIRGSGSLPVYRRSDDPAQMSRNEDTFHAVHEALARGAAIALFPEGISHSEPGLAPLKTGAARIALGAVPHTGGAFPIIPVGLVFRAKDRFRSEAHAVVGAPITWDDLAARPAGDHDAVRELTVRIERGMRQVTLNLARWEDDQVVRTAEAIWSSAHDADPSPAAGVARLTTAASALARLRARGDARWDALARDVREYARVLRVIGLRPADVSSQAGLGVAASWALRRLTLLGVVQLAVATLAVVLFWIPYRLTGIVASLMSHDKDTLSTYRVLTGTLVFMLWITGAALTLGCMRGTIAGIAAFCVLPGIAIVGLYAIDHWRSTLTTARRWLVAHDADPRISGLRARQLDLTRRLDEALAVHTRPQ